MSKKVSKRRKFITLLFMIIFIFSFSVPGVLAEEADSEVPTLMVEVPVSDLLSQENTEESGMDSSVSEEQTSAMQSEVNPDIDDLDQEDALAANKLQGNTEDLHKSSKADKGSKDKKEKDDDKGQGQDQAAGNLDDSDQDNKDNVRGKGQDNNPNKLDENSQDNDISKGNNKGEENREQETVTYDSGELSSNGIQPIFLDYMVNHNPCTDDDHLWLKDDTPNKGKDDGDYDGNDLSYQWDKELMHLSWANTSAEWYVKAVYLKGGTVTNLYCYTPEMQSDSNLHTPVNPKNGKYYGISHIIFCLVAADSSDPGGGTEDPGGGTENPGGGTENPGGGTEDPGGETENPGGGTENPGGGTENPGGETENPGGGTENPGGGTENPGGETENPGEGTENPGGGGQEITVEPETPNVQPEDPVAPEEPAANEVREEEELLVNPEEPTVKPETPNIVPREEIAVQPELPRTGSNNIMVILLGLFLAMAGIMMIRFSRKGMDR